MVYMTIPVAIAFNTTNMEVQLDEFISVILCLPMFYSSECRD